VIVRPLESGDREKWQLLWDGYNQFYERTVLEGVTDSTWARFFNPAEPVFAAVATVDGELAGMVHYLYHRSTSAIEDVCYLQDLFTAREKRGKGVGRALIEYVYRDAHAAGLHRVFWLTHEENPARKLYDKVASLSPFRRYVKDLG
jgi:GNAT superfamily N-acetyltransferase